MCYCELCPYVSLSQVVLAADMLGLEGLKDVAEMVLIRDYCRFFPKVRPDSFCFSLFHQRLRMSSGKHPTLSSNNSVMEISLNISTHRRVQHECNFLISAYCAAARLNQKSAVLILHPKKQCNTIVWCGRTNDNRTKQNNKLLSLLSSSRICFHTADSSVSSRLWKHLI